MTIGVIYSVTKVAFHLSGLVERTSSGHDGLLMDQSRSVLPLRSARRGNLESCGGKNVRARLGPFHLNWPEPVPFGRPERTCYGKRPEYGKLRHKTMCYLKQYQPLA